eukprot:TRINITY_DN20163_c0_g1_i1.p1 TRINITY_DN20163_c0_g1~~TRINITY_DN20163_c0_g1_i1.p1  ORF type:complete len:917 (-),score=167.05 TRINITY_DN20163_c0_g1_i1:250-2646(-)
MPSPRGRDPTDSCGNGFWTLAGCHLRHKRPSFVNATAGVPRLAADEEHRSPFIEREDITLADEEVVPLKAVVCGRALAKPPTDCAEVWPSSQAPPMLHQPVPLPASSWQSAQEQQWYLTGLKKALEVDRERLIAVVQGTLVQSELRLQGRMQAQTESLRLLLLSGLPQTEGVGGVAEGGAIDCGAGVCAGGAACLSAAHSRSSGRAQAKPADGYPSETSSHLGTTRLDQQTNFTLGVTQCSSKGSKEESRATEIGRNMSPRDSTIIVDCGGSSRQVTKAPVMRFAVDFHESVEEGPRPVLANARSTSSFKMDFSSCNSVTKQTTTPSTNLQMPKRAQLFPNSGDVREKLRQEMNSVTYSIQNSYYQNGIWQWIARNPAFENLTLAIIGLNAIWMAVDVDMNDAATLLQAQLPFQLADNLFCFYFSLEMFIRMMALERKHRGLQDFWFCMDSSLAVLLVTETWAIPCGMMWFHTSVVGQDIFDASFLRVVRMIRVTRVARMARLLKSLPEVMILVKGIGGAMRSVVFILCLLVAFVYVFAIVFRQVTAGTVTGEKYFATVGEAMATLFLMGTLPDQGDIIRKMLDGHFVYFLMMLAYIAVATLVVLNMLVGILVEAVSVVAQVEKESTLIDFAKSKLLLFFQSMDADGDGSLSRDEFEHLLHTPETARALQDFDVDVPGLADFVEMVFAEEGSLPFAELMNIVLQLRGCNTATVRDVVDLRKLVLTDLNAVLLRMQELLNVVVTAGGVNGGQPQIKTATGMTQDRSDLLTTALSSSTATRRTRSQERKVGTRATNIQPC